MKELVIRNLSFSYAMSDRKALSELNLSVTPGEFLSVVGRTGCGKTTLVRLLKPELAPKGKLEGSILLDGRDIYSMEAREAARRIGYVCQSPEQQIVTDRVWHELAFGLESLGTNRNEIRRRVCEISEFFGISEWFYRDTSELSGGEQQILSLAAVMVTKPEILILDEPLSRLDPVAVKSFMSILKRINEELGITVILVEHNIEEALSASDRVLMLENGQLAFLGSPCKMAGAASAENFMTFGMKVFSALDGVGDSPVNVRDTRSFLQKRVDDEGRDAVRSKMAKMTGDKGRCFGANDAEKPPVADKILPKDTHTVSIKDLYYRYPDSREFAINNLSLNISAGEVFCILGGNGSGKSTLLKLIIAEYQAAEGKLLIFDRKLKEYRNNSLYSEVLSWLPQNPQLLLAEESVKEALSGDLTPAYGLDFGDKSAYHPYDLSGGEQQLLAFLKIARRQRRLYLLDEPTKGLDHEKKVLLAAAVSQMKAEGKTILCVTHDAEFAGLCADRCALMFRGEIVSIAEPETFFSENIFYTTPLNRITDGIL